jgi:hypothetical protein
MPLTGVDFDVFSRQSGTNFVLDFVKSYACLKRNRPQKVVVVRIGEPDNYPGTIVNSFLDVCGRAYRKKSNTARTPLPSIYRTLHSVRFHSPVIPTWKPLGSSFSGTLSKSYLTK